MTGGGLRFEGVSYRFRSSRRPGVDALRQFSTECAPASIRCMMGPNGAGKSTVLALAAGLADSAAGRISFNNRPVSAMAPPPALGYLPQASAFPGALTVSEVLDFAFAMRGTPAAARDAVVQVGALGQVLTKATRTLSAGWARRLGLAVALAPPADLLLLDEPFVGLDLDSLDRVVAYIQERNRQGATVLLASHDYETVDRIDPHIMVLDEGCLIGEIESGGAGARSGYRRILEARGELLEPVARTRRDGDHESD
jgi:ABC-type multidrug transport system ATPase subunit